MLIAHTEDATQPRRHVLIASAIMIALLAIFARPQFALRTLTAAVQGEILMRSTIYWVVVLGQQRVRLKRIAMPPARFATRLPMSAKHAVPV